MIVLKHYKFTRIDKNKKQFNKLNDNGQIQRTFECYVHNDPRMELLILLTHALH